MTSFCPDPSQKIDCPSKKDCPLKSVAPVDCPSGFYCIAGLPKIQCASTMYCPPSSDAPRDCEEGYYCNGTAMFQCKPGRYCPPSSSAEVPCAEGYYCNGGKQIRCEAGYKCTGGASEPTKCIDPEYCPDGVRAVPCPAFFHCTVADKLECKEGEFSPLGESLCKECLAGYRCAANKMTACNEGEYSAPGSTACEVCGGPFYCPTTTSKVRCQPSYYCTATKAILCDIGSFCPTGELKVACPSLTTTRGEGAQLASDCLCALGYYRSSADGSCIKCQAGLDCSYFGLREEGLTAKRGYYYGEGKAWACDPPFACVGEGNQCKTGYEGFICGDCSDGYYRSSTLIDGWIGDCAPCSSSLAGLWFIFALIVVAIYVVLLDQESVYTSYFRLVFNHFQSIAIIGHMTAVNQVSSATLRGFFLFLSHLTLLTEFSYGYTAGACLFFLRGMPQPVNIVISKILFFIIISAMGLACIVLVNGLARFTSLPVAKFASHPSIEEAEFTKPSFIGSRFSRVLLMLLYLLCSGLLVSASDLFSCESWSNYATRWIGAWSYECNGLFQLKYALLTSIPLVLVLTLIPLGVFIQTKDLSVSSDREGEDKKKITDTTAIIEMKDKGKEFTYGWIFMNGFANKNGLEYCTFLKKAVLVLIFSDALKLNHTLKTGLAFCLYCLCFIPYLYHKEWNRLYVMYPLGWFVELLTVAYYALEAAQNLYAWVILLPNIGWALFVVALLVEKKRGTTTSKAAVDEVGVTLNPVI